MMKTRVLAALAFVAVASAASAQTPATPPPSEQDMLKMLHLGGRNQLGVLQYCQAQGSVGVDVVALQQRMLTMLPPAQVDGLAEAEAAGKRGEVQFGGTHVMLADAAKAQNTTPDAMCKQIGAMMQAQAAQLPK